MSSDQNQETLVMCAKLAEQAERYDDMAEVCMPYGCTKQKYNIFINYVKASIIFITRLIYLSVSPCSI